MTEWRKKHQVICVVLTYPANPAALAEDWLNSGYATHFVDKFEQLLLKCVWLEGILRVR